MDQVNISFLPNNGTDKKLPLVISPRWDCSVEFLQNWLRENKTWIDMQMNKHGAILIRGFDIDSPADIEQTVQAYKPNLCNEYRGTSPRLVLEGTKYVFSAAEVPVHYPIAQHIEMSFLPAPPKQLYFGCLQPSSSAGGETALADFRRVAQDIPDELKRKLLQKGLRYQRKHKKNASRFTYDVAETLSWPQLFGTSDRQEVERLCKQEGTKCHWEGQAGNETFVSTFQSQAFQMHPVTNEVVWFNHSQVFHWTTFPAELYFAWQRTKEFRLLLQCIIVSIYCVIRYCLLGHQMSLHCSFGDGEDISVQEMHEIRSAVHKNMVFSRWQKGDIIMIDNLSTSHGRQPTYDKGRKIAVSWADPWNKTNRSCENGIMAAPTEQDSRPIVCMENPQERSPESTLTKQGSKDLQAAVLARQIQMALKGMSHHNPQEESVFSNEVINILKDSIPCNGGFYKRVHSQPCFTDSAFWEKQD